MIRTLLILASVTLVVGGCASQKPPANTDIGAAHLAADVPPSAPQTRPTAIELPEPRAPERAPDEWPPLVTGLDLQSETMQARIAAAMADDFAAQVADELDLPTLIAAVLARNPAIAAARAQVQAVETEHTQLDALLRVRAQYRAFTEQLDAGVSARLPQTSAPEAYPLPGAEGLRSRLIELAAGVARASLHGAARQLVREGRETFARGVFQQERIAILADQQTLAESLLQVMKSRFETGSVDLGSVLALEERVARLADSRADAARQLTTEQAALARLMATDGSVGRLALPAPDLLAVEPADVSQQRLAAHPDARALELKRERMIAMQELVETMSRPDTDLDLSELPSPLADRPEFRPQPAPMPPSPWFGLQEARRAELAARAAALAAARAALIDTLRARSIAAAQDLTSARAELELQQTTLDGLARRAIDTTTESFRTGRVDVDRVLGALTQRLDASLGASIARRDIAIALAGHDYLLGPHHWD